MRIGALLAIGFSIIVVALSLTLFSRPASANPLGFSCPAMSATATTTLTFMTPGTATTTVLYDTYCVNGTNQPNTGNTNSTNLLSLLTQFTASSSPNSVLLMNIEYSQDGVDWYQDNYVASSTNPVSVVSTPNSYSWTFASSTVGGGAVASNNNRIGKLIRLYAPTRYVRAVYSLNIGGANGAVWGQILPIKERAN